MVSNKAHDNLASLPVAARAVNIFFPVSRQVEKCWADSAASAAIKYSSAINRSEAVEFSVFPLPAHWDFSTVENVLKCDKRHAVPRRTMKNCRFGVINERFVVCFFLIARQSHLPCNGSKLGQCHSDASSSSHSSLVDARPIAAQ